MFDMAIELVCCRNNTERKVTSRSGYGKVFEWPSTFGEWRYRMTPEKWRSVKPISYRQSRDQELMSSNPFPGATDTKGRAFGPAFRVYRESWEFPRKRISTQVPTRCPKSLPDDGPEEWVWILPGPGSQHGFPHHAPEAPSTAVRPQKPNLGPSPDRNHRPGSKLDRMFYS